MRKLFQVFLLEDLEGLQKSPDDPENGRDQNTQQYHCCYRKIEMKIISFNSYIAG